MKNIKIILFTLFSLLLFSACEEKLDPKSIFDNSDLAVETAFDKWCYENYVKPYNVRIEYRWDYYETSTGYNLVPPTLENSQKMAQIMKYTWFNSYEEINPSLLKVVCPRLIVLIGSQQYNTDGTLTLADAGGGLKVRIVGVNDFQLSPAFISGVERGVVHTMHHEFQHILNQTKNMPAAFKTISASSYIGGLWQDSTNTVARKRGFITSYARANFDEDFAELYSCYVSQPQSWWDGCLSEAGTSGAAIINQKIGYVRNYMKDTWKIDIDSLRDVVLRRNNEVLLWTDDNFQKFE